jgi:hypothetical protein
MKQLIWRMVKIQACDWMAIVCVQANKRFQRFAELVAAQPELKQLIMTAKSDDDDDTKNGATLLVPTNAAFDVSNFN